MKILELDRKNETLNEQVFRTYQNQRVGICVIGVLVPFLVWTSDFVQFGTIWPRESISAYYHSDHTLTRDLFVGNLFVVGVFLLLYRGYSTMENIVLDIGGVCLTLVALFPMRPPGFTFNGGATFIERIAYHETFLWGFPITVHGVCAVVFFGAIAVVAIFLSHKTLKDTQKYRLGPVYVVLGLLMILAPVTAWVLGRSIKIFLLETAGIVVFSAYWAVKTWEFWGTEGSVEATFSRCHDATES